MFLESLSFVRPYRPKAIMKMLPAVEAKTSISLITDSIIAFLARKREAVR